MVNTDPICKVNCFALPALVWPADIGNPTKQAGPCFKKKTDVGCGGGVGPSGTPVLNQDQPGKVTKSGTGGETKNPATGCNTGDTLCNWGSGLSKSFGSFANWGKYAIPIVAAVVIFIIIIVLKR